MCAMFLPRGVRQLNIKVTNPVVITKLKKDLTVLPRTGCLPTGSMPNRKNINRGRQNDGSGTDSNFTYTWFDHVSWLRAHQKFFKNPPYSCSRGTLKLELMILDRRNARPCLHFVINNTNFLMLTVNHAVNPTLCKANFMSVSDHILITLCRCQLCLIQSFAYS